MGKHRLQMDIQQLPAIAGSRGFEYKISLIHLKMIHLKMIHLKMIHLKTRWKYWEIHNNCASATVATVYQRALDNLPPLS